MDNLRARLIRLAHEHPEFREDLLPLVTAAGKNPADVIEDKRRAENAKRAGALSDGIRDALKAKGWVFKEGHSDGNILAYDHEETMSFHHKDLGTVSVRLHANDDGK